MLGEGLLREGEERLACEAATGEYLCGYKRTATLDVEAKLVERAIVRGAASIVIHNLEVLGLEGIRNFLKGGKLLHFLARG